MSPKTPETVIIVAIHESMATYPEGDGGSNLDHEWIPPEHSAHIAKAILRELAANGFLVVKKDA